MSELSIVHLSDTHGQHCQVRVPDGDILIYSGDCCLNGAQRDVELFFKWFRAQPHVYKIFIAGEYDRTLDKTKTLGVRPFWVKELIEEYLSPYLSFYLDDSGCDIEGISIWGSPYTPRGNGEDLDGFWGFSPHSRDMNEHWAKIPNNVDILVTHTPPYGKLDKDIYGHNKGCKYLRFQVQEKKPKLHLFGHVHEARGMTWDSNTVYMNSSILNATFTRTNIPQTIGIDLVSKSISSSRLITELNTVY